MRRVYSIILENRTFFNPNCGIEENKKAGEKKAGEETKSLTCYISLRSSFEVYVSAYAQLPGIFST